MTGLADDLLAWLENALPAAEDHSEISGRLTNTVEGEPSDTQRDLVSAFGYHLFDRSQRENREREGAPYGPMIEMGGRRFPARLDEASSDTLIVWKDAYEALDDPRSRSRLGDLLWLRKTQPRPDQFARGACAAFLALSCDGTWRDMEQTFALLRALELSRELRDETLTREVVARIVDATTIELDSGGDRPGIALRLIESLVSLRDDDRPTDLTNLLNRAEQEYGADPWHLDTINDLRVALSPSEQIPTLRRSQIETWRRRAADGEGIARVVDLEHALEIANAAGLAEEARELRVELQGISQADLGLASVSGEVSMPTAEIERFIEAFLEPATLAEALRVFGAHGPPGGEPTALAEEVDKQMAATPFQFLVNRVILDSSGFPIFRATTEEGRIRAALAQRRSFAAEIWSVFALNILRRMKERYDNPSPEEVTAAFSGGILDDALAERFARALALLWDDLPDESAHLAAPRIERAVRDLAALVGIPIINEPRGDETGGVRTLGVLLDALRGFLPTPGWHAYLVSLLVDPLGRNLRNTVAHGLREQTSAQDAALLIHAACFLRNLLVVPIDTEQSE
jgi:hypothetical protein